MAVEWAPVSLPVSRRLQTLAVIVWALVQASSVVLTVTFVLNPFTTALMLAYLGWIFLIDTGPETGTRKWMWMRRWRWWRYFAAYFPLRLVKTVDLDPKQTYVFGYHPHGIIGIGAFGNFATEATGFSEKFPGVEMRLVTLASNFKYPIYREYLMGLGICSCSRRSINTMLHGGISPLIVVGGAREALDARPGTYDLTLERRTGFVRLAIKHGASLVPIVSFGENDIFKQAKNEQGSRLRRCQEWWLSTFGFTIPFFSGRGIFQYTYGLMPQRRPITSVVGAPIPTVQKDNPTDADIKEYHDKYVEALVALFDAHKEEFAPDRHHDLRIIH